MRLVSIKIQRFRNFGTMQSMEVEPDVTCLVGKNESGKTSVLKALHRLNPANAPDKFDVATEYPRSRLASDRRKEDLSAVEPIEATFSLEESDAAAIADILSFTPPPQTVVIASRSYAGHLTVWIRCDLSDAVELACSDADVDEEDARELVACADVSALNAKVKDIATALSARSQHARSKAVRRVPAAVEKYRVIIDGTTNEKKGAAIAAMLPRFFYFSNYELLPGECDLTDLAERVRQKALKSGDETVLALLRLAGVRPESLLDEEYVSRKAELQAASSDLSRQVFRYWKQNDALSVVFDTDMPVVARTHHQVEIRHRVLHVELHDARHDVTTNFSTRSSGFQWFFSFLAAFSVHQDSSRRVVVLLDEPGTSLHGDAQRDFLQYIFSELGKSQQVIYTTHSQHMLDPTRYETMRAVHDRATRADPNLGVAITRVDLAADRQTILPVEAALGYSVSQHLFLGAGPHLVVEGSSDFIFLMRVSEYMISVGRTGLDRQLAIIPVGGVGNMPAFVALMGRKLDVRALIDGAQSTAVAAKVRSAADAAGIPPDRILVLGQLPGLPSSADIEDLFTPKDYLWLYVRSVRAVTEADLPATGEPILRRIEAALGKFDHARAAHLLTRERDAFFAQVDHETLDRFERLFELFRVSPTAGSCGPK
ncbi:MAG: DNA replication and repair protein RecF [Planctomycetes bacterium]|nr:DNA replication and repair protein RecF [Planctomycetota bacterium]